MSSEPRTNNSVEAFHNALQSSITNAHPTIWKLVDCLIREDGLATKKLIDIRLGSRTSNPKYRKVNQKLQYMIQNYDKDNKTTFLEMVSSCLHTF